MKEVAPGIYVETRYATGNVGIVVTGGGVVCIDAPMLPSDVYHWREQISSVTDEPIVSLIQTDYDQDRVVSTFMFDVPLIAHDSIVPKLKMYSSEKMVSQITDLLRRDGLDHRWHVRVPDITFSERLILYKGSRELHILHGGGHSVATSMVYLPTENVIFTGDIVACGTHPTMLQAETKEWLATLTALRKMSVDTIVPGRGGVCDREATQGVSEYIRDMRAAVRRCFQAGRSKSETSSVVIPEFIGLFPHDDTHRDQVRARIKTGSDRIYDEYRSEAKSSSVGSKAEKMASGRRKRKRS